MLLPTAGDVTVDGIDIARDPHAVRRRIGFLPDTPPLYNDMTVGRYLKFAAELRGMPSSESGKAVTEAEEKTATREVHDQPIFSLSHGYRQRVGVAQALVHRPKLLILDEPTSGLDPVQIVEMRNLIHDLKQNHTVLISSHILTEISQTCDRLLILGRGKILGVGSEHDLAAPRRPADRGRGRRAVARAIGRPHRHRHREWPCSGDRRRRGGRCRARSDLRPPVALAERHRRAAHRPWAAHLESIFLVDQDATERRQNTRPQ